MERRKRWREEEALGERKVENREAMGAIRDRGEKSDKSERGG